MARHASIAHIVGPDEPTVRSRVLTLARYFSRADHQVTVVGPLPRSAQRDLSAAGARWVTVDIDPRARPAAKYGAGHQLRRLLSPAGFEIIHCHGLFPAQLTLRATRGLTPRPAAITTLQHLSGQSHTLSQRRALNWVLARSDAVTVPAAAERAALQDISPRHAGRAKVVYDAVQVRRTRPDFDVGSKRQMLGVRPETAVIGIISPAVRGLGIERFLEAAAVLARDVPNVEFLLVGDGKDQAEFQRLAHDLRLSGSTVFRGDRLDIPEIIGSINVLVIPREIPGALQNALQAVVQEVSVVAVRSPGLSEVLSEIDPEALVPPDDAEALAEAIRRKLEDLPAPEAVEPTHVEGGVTIRYDEIFVSREAYDLDRAGLEAFVRTGESPARQAARRAVKKFSREAMILAELELYETLLGQRLASRPPEVEP